MDNIDRVQMEQLQREAAERLLKMRRRAERGVTPPMPDFVQTPYDGGENTDKSAAECRPPMHNAPGGLSFPGLFGLGGLQLGGDTAVILMLALLLLSEGGDRMLLLALLYIMM